MRPDELTKFTFDLDSFFENVFAEMMDLFGFKFLGEVGMEVDVF